jgi:hypothetical protein
MTHETHFRLVLPGGLASLDTFVPVSPQPHRIRAGCVLMIHEPSGRELTVHTSRLLPVEVEIEAAEHDAHRVCLTCGKVEGVVEDEVVCPNEASGVCTMVMYAAEGDAHAPHEEAAS